MMTDNAQQSIFAIIKQCQIYEESQHLIDAVRRRIQECPEEVHQVDNDLLQTPCHMAASHGQFEILAMLVLVGRANFKVPDKNNKYPIDLAQDLAKATKNDHIVRCFEALELDLKRREKREQLHVHDLIHAYAANPKDSAIGSKITSAFLHQQKDFSETTFWGRSVYHFVLAYGLFDWFDTMLRSLTLPIDIEDKSKQKPIDILRKCVVLSSKERSDLFTKKYYCPYFYKYLSLNQTSNNNLMHSKPTESIPGLRRSTVEAIIRSEGYSTSEVTSEVQKRGSSSRMPIIRRTKSRFLKGVNIFIDGDKHSDLRKYLSDHPSHVRQEGISLLMNTFERKKLHCAMILLENRLLLSECRNEQNFSIPELVKMDPTYRDFLESLARKIEENEQFKTLQRLEAGLKIDEDEFRENLKKTWPKKTKSTNFDKKLRKIAINEKYDINLFNQLYYLCAGDYFKEHIKDNAEPLFFKKIVIGLLAEYDANILIQIITALFPHLDQKQQIVAFALIKEILLNDHFTSCELEQIKQIKECYESFKEIAKGSEAFSFVRLTFDKMLELRAARRTPLKNAYKDIKELLHIASDQQQSFLRIFLKFDVSNEMQGFTKLYDSANILASELHSLTRRYYNKLKPEEFKQSVISTDSVNEPKGSVENFSIPHRESTSTLKQMQLLFDKISLYLVDIIFKTLPPAPDATHSHSASEDYQNKVHDHITHFLFIYIHTIDILLSENFDFNSANIVNAALNSSALSRLKVPFRQLPEGMQAKFQSFQTYFSGSNWVAQRKVIESNPRAIPFPQIFVTDLLHTNDLSFVHKADAAQQGASEKVIQSQIAKYYKHGKTYYFIGNMDTIDLENAPACSTDFLNEVNNMDTSREACMQMSFRIQPPFPSVDPNEIDLSPPLTPLQISHVFNWFKAHKLPIQLTVDKTGYVGPYIITPFSKHLKKKFQERFNVEKITRLSDQQIRELSIAEIKEMSPQELNSLSNEQIALFNNEQLRALEWIKQLSDQKIKNMSTAQIKEMSPQEIKSLTNRQIALFNNNQLMAFKPEQVQALTYDQLKALKHRKSFLFTKQALTLLGSNYKRQSDNLLAYWDLYKEFPAPNYTLTEIERDKDGKEKEKPKEYVMINPLNLNERLRSHGRNYFSKFNLNQKKSEIFNIEKFGKKSEELEKSFANLTLRKSKKEKNRAKYRSPKLHYESSGVDPRMGHEVSFFANKSKKKERRKSLSNILLSK